MQTEAHCFELMGEFSRRGGELFQTLGLDMLRNSCHCCTGPIPIIGPEFYRGMQGRKVGFAVYSDD